MAITDLYHNEGDDTPLTKAEQKLGLDMAKRVATDKSIGAMFVMEKISDATGAGFRVDGMGYQNEIGKGEMLFAVLKMLQMDEYSIAEEVVNYLRNTR